jgi:fatty-acyl-CoA synthase
VRATRPRLLIAEHGVRQVALDSRAGLGFDRVQTFRIGAGLPRGHDEVRPAPGVTDSDAEAPVLILFTSGTTGHPKGATFTHQNLAFAALNVLTAFGLTAMDEILIAVPIFHAGGLLIHTLPGLCAAATVTIHRQFDPGDLLEEIERQRITLVPCVPTMTFALAADPAWATADLSSLRCVVTGSTAVPNRAVEPWQRKGISVSQGYGMTETCVIATTMPPGSVPETAFTAGKPVICTEVRIVDDTSRDAAVGKPGEVWFRGPAVIQRYWDNEPATREAFCDRWLRSGDIGLIDLDGYLHIIGRQKDIIIVGSSNVYPSDLETVLEACADIHEAAVVGRFDEELGEVPVACVVPARGRSLAPAEVLELFENRVAAYKHPRDVLFFDELPRNATGKIDRKRLRDVIARRPVG